MQHIQEESINMIYDINLIDEKRVGKVYFKRDVKESKLKRKILFVLIFVSVIVILLLPNKIYATETSDNILTEQSEVIKGTNMSKLLRTASNVTTVDLTSLVSGGEVVHNCNNYLTKKHDSTSHWNECTICGKKYNTSSHSYTNEHWLKGDSCSITNKLVHTCNCGYSYQSDNTRAHTYTKYQYNEFEYNAFIDCSKCHERKDNHSCYKADGTRITCDNLGICATCNYKYTKKSDETFVYQVGKNLDMYCLNCNRYNGEITTSWEYIGIENGESHYKQYFTATTVYDVNNSTISVHSMAGDSSIVSYKNLKHTVNGNIITASVDVYVKKVESKVSSLIY